MSLGVDLCLYLSLVVLCGFVVPLSIVEITLSRVGLRYVALGFVVFLGSVIVQVLAQAGLVVLMKLLKCELVHIVAACVLVAALVQEFAKYGTVRIACRDVTDAASVGLGCGLVETLGVAVLIMLMPVLAHLQVPQVMPYPPEQLIPDILALACIERFLATMFHVGTSLIYFRNRKLTVPILLAIIHFAIDLAAVTAVMSQDLPMLFTAYTVLAITDTVLYIMYM